MAIVALYKGGMSREFCASDFRHTTRQFTEPIESLCLGLNNAGANSCVPVDISPEVLQAYLVVRTQYPAEQELHVAGQSAEAKQA